MVVRRSLALVLIGFGLMVSGFSAETKVDGEQRGRIDLGYELYLKFDDSGILANYHSMIERIVRDAAERVNEKMDIGGILIRVQVSPQNSIPEIGIGGYNPSTDEVIISVDPGFEELQISLSEHLGPTLAHELHHAKRRRSVGYGSTLLQAMVTEGLADHFSMEIYGIEAPIWSRAIDEKDIPLWLESMPSHWSNKGYDHSKWFFGSNAVVPRWLGYSIGFWLVENYLKDKPGETASGLVDKPASLFIP